MKAYVINLPRALERRKAMKQRLASTPLADAEFVDGVDGRALSQKQREELFDYYRYGRAFDAPPLPGEVGCALSHYKLWQKIASGNRPAIIMEDDILIDGDLTPYIARTEKWLDSNEPRAMLLTHFFVYRPETLSSENGLLETARAMQAYGAIFYAINPAGARLILNLGKPAYVADDWRYFSRHGLDVRCFLEHPVNIIAGDDTLIGRRVGYNLDAVEIFSRSCQRSFAAVDSMLYMTLCNKLRVFTGKWKIHLREPRMVKKS